MLSDDYIIKKLPFSFEESLNTVGVQEIKRYYTLIDIIKKYLNELINAIDGISTMTDE